MPCLAAGRPTRKRVESRRRQRRALPGLKLTSATLEAYRVANHPRSGKADREGSIAHVHSFDAGLHGLNELMMVAPLSARSVLPDYVGLHGSLALSLTRG
jgi:hypothetical protein